MPDSACTVETIADEDALRALAPEWERLSTSSALPNVFTTYDWYCAWQRNFASRECAGRRQPHVVVLRRDGAITGIAPLVRTMGSATALRMRKLQFMLGSNEWDYNDLIVGTGAEDATIEIFRSLKARSGEWDVMDLRQLRDRDGSLQRVLDGLAGARLPYRLMREEERCPYMTVEGSWEDFLQRLSGPSRHRFRKRLSKLHRTLGEGVRLRVVDTPHLEQDLLRRMIDLEKQKQVDGVQSAPFLGQHREAFESIWRTLGPKGWLCVALLEWKEQLLAWQLLFRCGDKLWGYLTVYDRAFGHLSPGSSLIPVAIDYAYAHGIHEFDFLSGEEPYKMQWNTGFHHTYRLVVWNRRWLSRLRAAAYLRLRVTRIDASADAQADQAED